MSITANTCNYYQYSSSTVATHRTDFGDIGAKCRFGIKIADDLVHCIQPNFAGTSLPQRPQLEYFL